MGPKDCCWPENKMENDPTLSMSCPHLSTVNSFIKLWVVAHHSLFLISVISRLKTLEIHVLLFHNSKLITNSSDVTYVSPIWFTIFVHEFFSVWAAEIENIFLIVPKQFLYQFACWKRNHNKHSLKKFVDSRFEIGETIVSTLKYISTTIYWIHDNYFQCSVFIGCCLPLLTRSTKKNQLGNWQKVRGHVCMYLCMFVCMYVCIQILIENIFYLKIWNFANNCFLTHMCEKAVHNI